MRPDGAALADLVTSHDDPVVAFLYQVKVNVLLLLLGGALAAVALGVGDGTRDGEVLWIGPS